MSKPAPQETEEPVSIYSEEISVEMEKWQKEIGFTAATISINQFFLSDRGIGITDLPEHYQAVRNHPETYNAKRLKELQDDIRTWNEADNFVLYWVEEYYLNQDGELESS